MTEFMVSPYLLSEVMSYLTLGGTAYLAWRFVRAYERRSVAPRRLRELTERVRLLERSLLQMEGSVREAVESQRFTTQLLAARSESRTGHARE